VKWWLLRTKILDGRKSWGINSLWQYRKEIDMFFILPFRFLLCEIRTRIMTILWTCKKKIENVEEKLDDLSAQVSRLFDLYILEREHGYHSIYFLVVFVAILAM
jgi:hypothetical protein